MKKIGIIGGAGPLASALLYETLVKECYALRKPVPEMVLINYPFTRGLTLTERDQHHHILKHELTSASQILIQQEVDIALLACNTLHKYLGEISFPNIEFLSLPQAVLSNALTHNHRNLLILGTQNTCFEGLYKHRDVKLVYPEYAEQALIDRIIDQVLEGTILSENAFLISQMLKMKKGCDGAVLGCTELAVLHHHFPIRSPLTIYDSIKIPAQILIRGLS